MGPQVFDGHVQLVADLLVQAGGDAHPTCLGQAFQSCGHVHAVPEEVAVGDHHIAEVDADAKAQLLLIWQLRIAARDLFLAGQSAAHRFDSTGELGKDRVAASVDHPSLMVGDPREDHLSVSREALKGGLLVCPHEAAVAHHVRR